MSVRSSTIWHHQDQPYKPDTSVLQSAWEIAIHFRCKRSRFHNLRIPRKKFSRHHRDNDQSCRWRCALLLPQGPVLQKLQYCLLCITLWLCDSFTSLLMVGLAIDTIYGYIQKVIWNPIHNLWMKHWCRYIDSLHNEFDICVRSLTFCIDEIYSIVQRLINLTSPKEKIWL